MLYLLEVYTVWDFAGMQIIFYFVMIQLCALNPPYPKG